MYARYVYSFKCNAQHSSQCNAYYSATVQVTLKSNQNVISIVTETTKGTQIQYRSTAGNTLQLV